MLGRFKTAWKGLKLATQVRKAWKRGGGSATAGGAIALAVDPKPFGQFVFGVMAHFFPGFMASLPAESSVEVLGVLTAMLIGWVIGAVKEEATDKVEQRAAKKAAQVQ